MIAQVITDRWLSEKRWNWGEENQGHNAEVNTTLKFFEEWSLKWPDVWRGSQIQLCVYNESKDMKGKEYRDCLVMDQSTLKFRQNLWIRSALIWKEIKERTKTRT